MKRLAHADFKYVVYSFDYSINVRGDVWSKSVFVLSFFTSLTAEIKVTKTKQQLYYLKITLQIELLLNGVLYLLFAEITRRLNFAISYREIWLWRRFSGWRKYWRNAPGEGQNSKHITTSHFHLSSIYQVVFFYIKFITWC